MKNLILTLFILVIVLSGCMSYEHVGNSKILVTEKIASLQKGMSKTEVIKLFGSPESESFASGRNIIDYRFSETEIIPHWMSTDVNIATANLMVTFKDNIIEDIYYNKSNNFKHISDETESSE
ncbi:MAG: outer membrane protein assembly factor BamE [Rickettsiales bacterium]|mgnify:CR=1 FL=1|jgi:outer membrane protein assembly factor BamE (lipoprotein component of BamABCDE complex)|nr:outer membrane protein assembly factor BamE [Rickettsiales bacterium]